MANNPIRFRREGSGPLLAFEQKKNEGKKNAGPPQTTKKKEEDYGCALRICR